MGLVGRISYKFLVGGIFAVLIFSLVGSQQAMAGNPDIVMFKCLTSDGTIGGCDTVEGSVGSILREVGQSTFFRIDATLDFGTIENVKVQDKLPSGLVFLSSTFDGNGYDPVTGVWDIGTMAGEGSTRSLIIEFQAKTATCGFDILNTATLAIEDEQSFNNVASATVLVVADLLAEDVIALKEQGSTLEDFRELDCPLLGGGEHEPPTIGMNLAGNYQIVPDGIGIDGQFWTVTENFHEGFELVQMLTSTHTISNRIYCANGVNTCNHITLSGAPYGTDINSALWKVSADKNLLGELTVTKDDPDGYLGVTTCTSQVQAEKYWFTTCTIDFKISTPGIMLGVQVWDTYGGVRNFYFNDGIEIIDTFGYPYVDTEFEPPLDVPRLCLADDPDKRTSCAFAEKVQLEIERAERLLT